MNLRKTLSTILSVAVLSGSFFTQAVAQEAGVDNIKERLSILETARNLNLERSAAITRYANDIGYNLIVDSRTLLTAGEAGLVLIGAIVVANRNRHVSHAQYAKTLDQNLYMERTVAEQTLEASLDALKKVANLPDGQERLGEFALKMIDDRNLRAENLKATQAKVQSSYVAAEYAADIRTLHSEAALLRANVGNKEGLLNLITNLFRKATQSELRSLVQQTSHEIMIEYQLASLFAHDAKSPRANMKQKVVDRAVLVRNTSMLLPLAFISLAAADFYNTEQSYWIKAQMNSGKTLNAILNDTLKSLSQNEDDITKALSQLPNDSSLAVSTH